MTTQSTDPKEKVGYVCPTCRMVFSLSRDLGGNGVTCPGCENLLTIPTSADKVSELVISKKTYNRAEALDQTNHVVKHHRTLLEGEHHEWADEQFESGDKGMKIMIPVAIFALLLTGALTYLLFSEKDEVTEIASGDLPTLVGKPELGGGDESEVPEEKVYLYDPEDEDQVAQVEDFLKGVFAAKTVDELLPYVKPVENIREKMVRFYKGEKLTHSPFKSLSKVTNSADYPGYVTMLCQTEDYNNQVGVLKYSRDEILLDWESFVAFSDMTWEELAEKKPTESVRVRVTAKRAYYYNNEFTDENQWQAVSLISPNEEDPIYGYVEKGSATAYRLFSFGNSDNRQVILDIYYPKDSKKGDQVFIDKIVEQGWVIIEEE